MCQLNFHLKSPLKKITFIHYSFVEARINVYYAAVSKRASVTMASVASWSKPKKSIHRNATTWNLPHWVKLIPNEITHLAAIYNTFVGGKLHWIVFNSTCCKRFACNPANYRTFFTAKLIGWGCKQHHGLHKWFPFQWEN